MYERRFLVINVSTKGAAQKIRRSSKTLIIREGTFLIGGGVGWAGVF